MKILHIVRAGEYSGLESVAAHILAELSHENEVFYAAPKGAGLETVGKMGITGVPCETDKVSAVKALYRRLMPDVVHAHDPRVSFVCARAGIPFIAHLHSNCSWLKSLCPNSLALLEVCRKADKIICVSDSIPDEYIFSRFMTEKAVVMNNYIDRAEVIGKAREGYIKHFDICWVGRLVGEKQPEKLVLLTEALRKKLPDIKAVMVGDGELAGRIKALISEKGLDRNIEMTGYLENPYKVMNNSSVGVLTSQVEGFGLVAAEALVLGKPFVCLSAGGLANIVNRENGRLCESVEDMAEEICLLLTDKELYAKKSAAASSFSYRFTNKEEYIDNIKVLYSEFVHKHQK